MPWWGWLVAAIAFWLFTARWSMRWCRELQPDGDLDVHILVSVLIPWIAILNLFPAWLTKRGWRLDERKLRALVGESRWHRAERLAHEHEQRCSDLGMPT
jgi:hypothetical protein